MLKVVKSFYQFLFLKHRQILKHSRFLKHSLRKLSLLKKFQSLFKRFTFHFGFTSIWCFFTFSLLEFVEFTLSFWRLLSDREFLIYEFGNPRWQGLQLKAALFLQVPCHTGGGCWNLSKTTCDYIINTLLQYFFLFGFQCFLFV
jgi:hypothetical protein